MTITRTNIREVFVSAFVADDTDTLNLVYSFLQSHGWSGYISVEDAIAALEARTGLFRDAVLGG